ncbi:MAG: hypothetical protein OXC03_06205 [Flavobacteriaceae bacterium]|nr:hypothetical protein [Flavobacteriaceae bacterium]
MKKFILPFIMSLLAVSFIGSTDSGTYGFADSTLEMFVELNEATCTVTLTEKKEYEDDEDGRGSGTHTATATEKNCRKATRIAKRKLRKMK